MAQCAGRPPVLAAADRRPALRETVSWAGAQSRQHGISRRWHCLWPNIEERFSGTAAK